MSPRVGMVNGFWAQNIGNAFFNLGGEWLLQQVFGPDRVCKVQDHPAYRTFWDQHAGFPAHDARFIEDLDLDVLVLQGPMLTTSFESLWGSTLREFKRRGGSVVLLGAGLFKFTGAEIASARQFLMWLRPEVLITRDSVTFAAVNDLCARAYDGIDSAFFLPEAYEPPTVNASPYCCMTFDRWVEPRVSVAEGDHQTWTVDAVRPQLLDRISSAGKWQSYIAHLLDRRALPDEIAGRRVIRPEHRTQPYVRRKIYARCGALASDEPFTYLAAYASADFTLSDRVHACVASVAYGTPAMLFTPSPRSFLFDRLGLSGVRDGLLYLESDRRVDEVQSELAFLRDVFRP